MNKSLPETSFLFAGKQHLMMQEILLEKREKQLTKVKQWFFNIFWQN